MPQPWRRLPGATAQSGSSNHSWSFTALQENYMEGQAMVWQACTIFIISAKAFFVCIMS